MSEKLASQSSPTVRRWELGALLRELRHSSGLTVEQVSERLLCSAAKVSRLETGQRAPSLRDVRDLCDLYRVSDGERQRLMSMAREARQPAWWQQYDVPHAYTTYIGLEAAATSISVYELALVPGLLQTEAYARAVVLQPESPEADEELRQKLELRLGRQALVTREDPPRLSFVLDEAVLRRQVGGPAVMDAQLNHLLRVSRLPHISLQVVPFSKGVHPGLSGSFTILGFAEPVLSDVVFVETVAGEQPLERDAELNRFRSAFRRLRAVALPPEDSRVLLADAIS